ncbi:MAG: hypothetical protein ACYC1D_10980 [Acidimicrobiales bacterium]
MDMARVALAHAGGDHAPGAERYMVHLVVRESGEPTLLDGTPLDPSSAGAAACDSARVVHLLGPGGEPLTLGRKSRVWSCAQRRAAQVRDGGHCRFPGCERRIADLHHLLPWSDGRPKASPSIVIDARQPSCEAD